MRRSLALATLAMLASTGLASAETVAREQDIADVRLGQRILVDDGSCPAGQIKEVAGAQMTTSGVLRTKNAFRGWGRSRGSPNTPLSSLRKQGPITTGGCCRQSRRPAFPIRPAAAYGSLRSQGRQCALGKRSRSRDMIFVRAIQFRCPSEERAQGKPGAECTRRSRAPKHTGIPRAEAHGQSTTGSADHAGFPHAMFDGLYVLSPVSGVDCHRCRPRTGGADRRHGRGARTTRLRRTPQRFVRRASPPDAAASIASRPNVS